MLIHQATLANGLHVIHAEVPDTQMTALCLLYKVGARNEDPAHTGWAHLLEHLMYEGTPRIPDYDAQVQLVGGENNAFTNNDFTSFYVTMPQRHIETAFRLEADRMRGISLADDSVEVQKQVVIEEFRQRDLGQPYGDLQHLLRPLAYRQHPYRWPTIGVDIGHIEGATPEAIRDFYHRHYHPSNAILSIAGATPWDKALSLARQYFEPIADTPFPIPVLPEEPKQTRMRRLTVRRDVPLDMLVMAWHMPGRNDSRFTACDVITDLLANGHSSRLNQRLIGERRLFNTIDAYISGSTDPGLIHIVGRVNPDVSMADAEQAVWQEVDRLKHEPIDEQELEKVRNRFESERVFNHISHLNVAISLAQHALYGTTPDEEIRRYRAVSATDVQQAARTFLTRQGCSVLHYLSRPIGEHTE